MSKRWSCCLTLTHVAPQVRTQVMTTALPDALFALAQANFAAGAEFGALVRENIGTARMKVKSDTDNIAGVRLPTFEPMVGSADGEPCDCHPLHFALSTSVARISLPTAFVRLVQFAHVPSMLTAPSICSRMQRTSSLVSARAVERSKTANGNGSRLSRCSFISGPSRHRFVLSTK